MTQMNQNDLVQDQRLGQNVEYLVRGLISQITQLTMTNSNGTSNDPEYKEKMKWWENFRV